MAKKEVYYFSVPSRLVDFIERRDNQYMPLEAEHDKSYADAWAKISHPSHDLSQLGLGPNGTQKIGLPDVAIIYGEQVAPLFTWARKDPPQYTGSVQPYNIVSATVYFGAEVLHSHDHADLTVSDSGKLEWDEALGKAFHQYKELEVLARAVDKTSEKCRQSLNMGTVADVQKLRDIYTSTGNCRLRTSDLVSNICVSVTNRIVQSMPLEFALHIPEFQHKIQSGYLSYGMSFPEKPTSPEKQVMSAVQKALTWLGETVKAEGLCTNPEHWDEFQKIRNEVNEIDAKLSVEPKNAPLVFLVEHRPLGKVVNASVSAAMSLPAFGSWSEMNQYMQREAARLSKEDPSNAGYFMIYTGHTRAVRPEMSWKDVMLTNTTVQMLGNGIFPQKSMYLTQAIAEQEFRLSTWDAIKEFAEARGLDWHEVVEKPLQEMELIRKAFEPGGILENGYMIQSAALGQPELQPLRNIQRILTGEHATWDTVRAAMVIDETYIKNFTDKVEKGMSPAEAKRQEMLYALKDAEHYMMFDPGYAHNEELYKVFSGILEAHRHDPNAYAEDLLEWHADGCLEEFNHEDV
jgi:hypothetical protein